MMSLTATILFLVLMCLGLPIAASLGLAAGAVIFWYDLPLAVIAQRTVNSLDSTPLLAVPMFIFAASIFNTAGITQHLFDWIRMLVGRIRGGLGYVTILTHLVFSGISGAALADIGALGSIQIRMMRQQGYKDEFSAGICMAASTLGPIFPPSIPLVIYATTAEISAVRLMLAGIIPSLVIAGVLIAQVWWLARRQGLPTDTVEVTRASFMRQTMIALPAIMAPVILIAGMMAGVLGSTEAAGITVVYAILVGLLIYRRLDWANFLESARETVLACASILLIVGVSELFAWVLAIDQIPTIAAQFLIGLSNNPYVLLIIANVILLAAGTILEPLPAILLLTPILAPGLHQAGVDPVHLGIVVVLNLMIGLLTPPVGMSLYMVSNIGKIPLERVMAGAVPFIVSLIIALAIVTFVPAFSTWLPDLVMK
jgi:tripartite ATP-independent transporter DctM subunit